MQLLCYALNMRTVQTAVVVPVQERLIKTDLESSGLYFSQFPMCWPRKFITITFFSVCAQRMLRQLRDFGWLPGCCYGVLGIFIVYFTPFVFVCLFLNLAVYALEVFCFVLFFRNNSFCKLQTYSSRWVQVTVFMSESLNRVVQKQVTAVMSESLNNLLRLCFSPLFYALPLLTNFPPSSSRVPTTDGTLAICLNGTP